MVGGHTTQGVRVQFETCVDDYGEVWIDGECNRLALLRKVIALLPNELAEHNEKGFGSDESIGEVFARFAESKLLEFDEDLPEDFWVDDRLQRLVEENRSDFQSVDSMT